MQYFRDKKIKMSEIKHKVFISYHHEDKDEAEGLSQMKNVYK